MARITLKGTPCNTIGELPKQGDQLPDFELTNTNLESVTRSSFSGKRLVLNCFPSVDTPVCAASVKEFNQRATAEENVEVLCISQDLPFALKRFCGAEGIERAVPLSAFRSPEFGKKLGILITDGPLAGLFARAVIVTDQEGKVTYTQLVPEIAEEPDYDAALEAIKG